MRVVLQVLGAIALTVLIVAMLLLVRWARVEAPLVHNALWNFSEASSKVNAAAGAQIEHLSNELEATQKATTAAKKFFEHTDLAINGRRNDGLIPQAAVFLQSLNKDAQDLDMTIGSLNATVLSGQASIAQLQGTFTRVSELVAALQQQVTDPVIKETLAKLLEASTNASAGLGELSASSKDLHQIADKARETYLKPVNLWWGLVKELLPLAGSAAQVVK